MSGNKTMRRRLLVERKVQGALGMRVVMHWMIYLSGTVGITIALRLAGNIDQSSMGEIASLALREQWVSLVVIVALLPWFIHDALQLSSRFAGPMLRLRSAMRELADEEQMEPISLRNGDFWTEVADDFNALRERVIDERAVLKQLRAEQSVGTQNSLATAAPTTGIAVLGPTLSPSAVGQLS